MLLLRKWRADLKAFLYIFPQKVGAWLSTSVYDVPVSNLDLSEPLKSALQVALKSCDNSQQLAAFRQGMQWCGYRPTVHTHHENCCTIPYLNYHHHGGPDVCSSCDHAMKYAKWPSPPSSMANMLKLRLCLHKNILASKHVNLYMFTPFIYMEMA